MRHLLFIALLAAAACGERAAFRPTENVRATGHGGQPAASYEIRAAPDVEPHAKVDVWSRGAREEEGRTVIDMTLAVRNVGPQPIVIDDRSLHLEAYANDGARLPDAAVVLLTQPLHVDPGSARDVRVRFALPAAVSPDEIGGLRLRWSLNHDSGQRYVQFTEFRRVREQHVPGYVAYYDPLFGFYDPFWYPHSFHYRVPVARVYVDADDGGFVRDHRRSRSVRR